MTAEIRLSGACGNSPKNAFAEECAVRLLTADQQALESALAADCVAHLPGGEQVSGAPAIAAGFATATGKPAWITIMHAITHGRVGAVNGTIATKDGERGFAISLAFASTKANSVTAIRLYLS